MGSEGQISIKSNAEVFYRNYLKKKKNISALEALRNALYKFKTYLLTY